MPLKIGIASQSSFPPLSVDGILLANWLIVF
jgi:hypothetical protein